MNWGILIAVLAYEVLVIVGIGSYLSRQAKKAEAGEGGFLLSNRDLPVAVVAVTLALTVLGTPHIFGLFEMAYGMGAVGIWFGLAHVVLLVVACTTTGRWARRLHVTTMPEILDMLFGGTPRLMVACVMAGMVFGILTLEAQGIGIVFSTVTGMSIQKGAIIGGLFGVLYVIMAGMKEIGWVNLVNCVVMYVGLILSTIILGTKLAGGFGGVEAWYAHEGLSQNLSIWGSPAQMITFSLAVVLSTVFCQSISQQLMQPAMSAKSEHTIRKALWIAAPVNGMFGVFVICIGLAARAHPEFSQLGPKMAAPTMLLHLLPGWLVAWLFASLLAAVLSSFAMAVMAPATIFTVDIYKNLFKPSANEKEVTKVTRLVVVALALIAMGVAAYLPPIVAAMNWLFAWLTPVFWLIIIGLFWKRSTTAAIWTMVVCWVANFLWTFTGAPEMLGMVGIPNVYVTCVLSWVVGITLTAVTPGKPGLFKSGELPIAATGQQS